MSEKLHCINNMNPGYFPLAATALKWQQIPLFLHIFARFLGTPVISTNIRTVFFFVKTAIFLQRKCLCVPDCAYKESMLINFTQMSLCKIFVIQAILYQIKRDVAVWKRLGCPQCMQRTLWQKVAMPYTGFRLFNTVWNSRYILNHDYNHKETYFVCALHVIPCFSKTSRPLVCWNNRDCRRSDNG